MQRTNTSKTQITEQANTFNLTLSCTPNKLTITLKDFIDWMIYFKEYTQDDVGGEIYKKMDLLDVYHAFEQIKGRCDEQSMQGKQNCLGKLVKYQFGTIIENEKIPCYKIQREGKITAYQVMIDARTKTQSIYQSKLQLNKIRSMSEIEISTQRSAIDRKQIFGELSWEIQKQKIQKQGLIKRIMDLEYENVKLKQKLAKTKSQLIYKIEQLENKLSLKNQKQNQKIQSFKKELNLKNDQNLQIQNHKILSIKQQLQQKLQLQIKRNLDKFTQIQPYLEQLLKPIKYKQTLLNLQQKYITNFKLHNLKLQHMNTEWTHYIFNKPINPNQSTKFTIKIIQTQSRWIMVGVVDHAKQKDNRSSFESGNAMSYHGINAYKCPEGTYEGNGFKQGDVVQVDVDRTSKTVKYIIKGLLEATQMNVILGDSSRVFMPYIEMHNINDIVEWMLE